MMIKYINEMIVSHFVRDLKAMKFSSPRTVLFIAKCKFSLMIYVWGLLLIGFSERFILGKSYLENIPNGRLYASLIILLVYFPLDKITWSLDKVAAYASKDENDSILKKRFLLFFILVGLGFVFLMLIAYQNKWHPLP
jgi:hypothetical protein